MWIAELFMGIVVLAIWVWMFGNPREVEGWFEDRRTKKHQARVLKLEREWNPRGTAYREFSRMDSTSQSARSQHAPTASAVRGQVRANVRVIRGGIDSGFGG